MQLLNAPVCLVFILLPSVISVTGVILESFKSSVLMQTTKSSSVLKPSATVHTIYSLSYMQSVPSHSCVQFCLLFGLIGGYCVCSYISDGKQPCFVLHFGYPCDHSIFNCHLKNPPNWKNYLHCLWGMPYVSLESHLKMHPVWPTDCFYFSCCHGHFILPSSIQLAEKVEICFQINKDAVSHSTPFLLPLFFSFWEDADVWSVKVTH